MGQGFYLLHSTEMVLIGVKYMKAQPMEYISKVTNDVIFAEPRQRSRKPDELYHIIEKMVRSRNSGWCSSIAVVFFPL